MWLHFKAITINRFGFVKLVDELVGDFVQRGFPCVKFGQVFNFTCLVIFGVEVKRFGFQPEADVF